MIVSSFSSSVFVSLSFMLVVIQQLIEFWTDQIITCTTNPAPMGCCKQNLDCFDSLKDTTTPCYIVPIRIATNITVTIGTVSYRNKHHCNDPYRIVSQRSLPQQTKSNHSATNIIATNMLDWYWTHHSTASQRVRSYCNKRYRNNHNKHHCNDLHRIVLQQSLPQQTQLYHSVTNIIATNMLDWYQTRHSTALQRTGPYRNKQNCNECNHIASHITRNQNDKQHRIAPQQTELQ